MEADFYRLLLRFVLKVKNEPDVLTKPFRLYDGSDRHIEDVMDHVKEMKESPHKLLPLQLAARHMVSVGVQVDEDTIIRRAHQLFVNAFGIFDEDIYRKMNALSYEVALGLFVEGSIFDHSCHPNAAQVYEGTTMYVRALREIDSQNEAILISYTDLMQARQDRQEKLREGYYFECKCPKCSNPADEHLYLEFQCLKEQFKKFDINDQCEEAYRTAKMMAPIVTNLLGEFSIWGTEILWLCVQFGLLARQKTNQQNIPKELLEDWKRFKTSVLITHGVRHSFYTSSVGSVVGDLFDKQLPV